MNAILLLGYLYTGYRKNIEARALYQRAIQSGRLAPEESKLLEEWMTGLPK